MQTRILSTVAALLCASPVFALWATNYDGTLATLSLDGTATTNYSLKLASFTDTCGTDPSWLLRDPKNRILYCSTESPNGTIVAFTVDANKTLHPAVNITTNLGGAVNMVRYGIKPGVEGLATAHYSASVVTAFKLPLNSSTSKPLDTFHYNIPRPGPSADRQSIAHPHQVLLDPTGRFIVSPDLGADVVHVSAINATSGQLNSCPSLKVRLGSGPRHAAFWVSKLSSDVSTNSSSCPTPGSSVNPTMMYLVSELSNDVTAFSVSYPAGGCMNFTQTQIAASFPGAAPNGSAVGEVQARDNYLYVSNRNANSTGPGVDSIAQFNLDALDGKMTFHKLSSSYGFYPRTFSIRKSGDQVAIGNQLSGTVVIVARDPKTGELGEKLASVNVRSNSTISVGGGVSSVVWDQMADGGVGAE